MSAGRFKTYPDCEASRVADSYRKGPVRQAVGEDSTGDYTGWPKQGRVLSVPGRSLDGARAYCLVGRPRRHAWPAQRAPPCSSHPDRGSHTVA